MGLGGESDTAGRKAAVAYRKKVLNHLKNLLYNSTFVDYFNVFLNLPVFGQRAMFKLQTKTFIFSPPVGARINNYRVLDWIHEERYRLFTKTRLAHEYVLCRSLLKVGFSFRVKDKSCKEQVPNLMPQFVKNLLGNVAGMYLFRQYLRGTAGIKVISCWMHIQALRKTSDMATRVDLFSALRRLYLRTMPMLSRDGDSWTHVLAWDLLNFPVVPVLNERLRERINSGGPVSKLELDPMAKECLENTQAVLLIALQTYWLPCYVLHVLASHSPPMLMQLFKKSKKEPVNSKVVDMILRSCTLFKTPSSRVRHLGVPRSKPRPSETSSLLTLSSQMDASVQQFSPSSSMCRSPSKLSGTSSTHDSGTYAMSVPFSNDPNGSSGVLPPIQVSLTNTTVTTTATVEDLADEGWGVPAEEVTGAPEDPQEDNANRTDGVWDVPTGEVTGAPEDPQDDNANRTGNRVSSGESSSRSLSQQSSLTVDIMTCQDSPMQRPQEDHCHQHIAEAEATTSQHAQRCQGQGQRETRGERALGVPESASLLLTGLDLTISGRRRTLSPLHSTISSSSRSSQVHSEESSRFPQDRLHQSTFHAMCSVSTAPGRREFRGTGWHQDQSQGHPNPETHLSRISRNAGEENWSQKRPSSTSAEEGQKDEFEDDDDDDGDDDDDPLNYFIMDDARESSSEYPDSSNVSPSSSWLSLSSEDGASDDADNDTDMDVFLLFSSHEPTTSTPRSEPGSDSLEQSSHHHPTTTTEQRDTETECGKENSNADPPDGSYRQSADPSTSSLREASSSHHHESATPAWSSLVISRNSSEQDQRQQQERNNNQSCMDSSRSEGESDASQRQSDGNDDGESEDGRSNRRQQKPNSGSASSSGDSCKSGSTPENAERSNNSSSSRRGRQGEEQRNNNYGAKDGGQGTNKTRTATFFGELHNLFGRSSSKSGSTSSSSVDISTTTSSEDGDDGSGTSILKKIEADIQKEVRKKRKKQEAKQAKLRKLQMEMMLKEGGPRVSITNLTKMALQDMAKHQTEDQFDSILRHFIFGARDLQDDASKSDRRTLCVLACDSAAGFPLRKYLRSNRQAYSITHLDFWSALRRYVQLRSLCCAGDVTSSENLPEIFKLLDRQIHVASSFLKEEPLASGFVRSRDKAGDPNRSKGRERQNTKVAPNQLLKPRTRTQMLEELSSRKHTTLMNAVMDVVANTLSIPVTMYLLYDLYNFHTIALRTSHLDTSSEDIASSMYIEESCSATKAAESAGRIRFAEQSDHAEPWHDEPETDVNFYGEPELRHVEDKHGARIGVLTEQHRIMAFRYLIMISEDLDSADLYDMTDLTEMIWSDFGSLHISVQPRVLNPLLRSLQPFKRLTREEMETLTLVTRTLLDAEIDPHEDPGSSSIFFRKKNTINFTYDMLIQMGQRRGAIEAFRTVIPKDFSEILTDDYHYCFFRLYLINKGPGHVDPLSFWKAVEETKTVHDHEERDKRYNFIKYKFLLSARRDNLLVDSNQALRVGMNYRGSPGQILQLQGHVRDQLEKKWWLDYAIMWPTLEELLNSREGHDEAWTEELVADALGRDTVVADVMQWGKDVHLLNYSEDESSETSLPAETESHSFIYGQESEQGSSDSGDELLDRKASPKPGSAQRRIRSKRSPISQQVSPRHREISTSDPSSPKSTIVKSQRSGSLPTSRRSSAQHRSSFSCSNSPAQSSPATSRRTSRAFSGRRTSMKYDASTSRQRTPPAQQTPPTTPGGRFIPSKVEETALSLSEAEIGSLSTGKEEETAGGASSTSAAKSSKADKKPAMKKKKKEQAKGQRPDSGISVLSRLGVNKVGFPVSSSPSPETLASQTSALAKQEAGTAVASTASDLHDLTPPQSEERGAKRSITKRSQMKGRHAQPGARRKTGKPYYNDHITEEAEMALKRKRRRKVLYLMTRIAKVINAFMSTLRDPIEMRLFEAFLRKELELAQAKSQVPFNSDKPTYTRMGNSNMLVVINKLPTDLRFWVEVDRFKRQALEMEALKEEYSEEWDSMQDFLSMRANAIINCFLSSVAPPPVQVNLSDQDAFRITATFARQGACPALFHVAILRLTPILIFFWKQYQFENRLKTKKLADHTFLGNLPHPHEGTPDYSKCTIKDYQPIYIDFEDHHLRGASKQLQATGQMSLPQKGAWEEDEGASKEAEPGEPFATTTSANQQLEGRLKFSLVSGIQVIMPITDDIRRHRREERKVKEKEQKLKEKEAEKEASEKATTKEKGKDAAGTQKKEKDVVGKKGEEVAAEKKEAGDKGKEKAKGEKKRGSEDEKKKVDWGKDEWKEEEGEAEKDASRHKKKLSRGRLLDPGESLDVKEMSLDSVKEEKEKRGKKFLTPIQYQPASVEQRVLVPIFKTVLSQFDIHSEDPLYPTVVELERAVKTAAQEAQRNKPKIAKGDFEPVLEEYVFKKKPRKVPHQKREQQQQGQGKQGGRKTPPPSTSSTGSVKEEKTSSRGMVDDGNHLSLIRINDLNAPKAGAANKESSKMCKELRKTLKNKQKLKRQQMKKATRTPSLLDDEKVKQFVVQRKESIQMEKRLLRKTSRQEQKQKEQQQKKQRQQALRSVSNGIFSAEKAGFTEATLAKEQKKKSVKGKQIKSTLKRLKDLGQNCSTPETLPYVKVFKQFEKQPKACFSELTHKHSKEAAASRSKSRELMRSVSGMAKDWDGKDGARRQSQQPPRVQKKSVSGTEKKAVSVAHMAHTEKKAVSVAHMAHTEKKTVSVAHMAHTEKKAVSVAHMAHTEKEADSVAHMAHTEKEADSVAHMAQAIVDLASHLEKHGVEIQDILDPDALQMFMELGVKQEQQDAEYDPPEGEDLAYHLSTTVERILHTRRSIAFLLGTREKEDAGRGVRGGALVGQQTTLSSMESRAQDRERIRLCMRRASALDVPTSLPSLTEKISATGRGVAFRDGQETPRRVTTPEIVETQRKGRPRRKKPRACSLQECQHK